MAKNTRETLLDYTFAEIHQYGYFQASTSDILKKCKIPKGSMYHYFSSKHDLTLAVIAERVHPKSVKNYHVHIQDSALVGLISFLEQISFSHKAFKYGCIMHKLIVEMAHLDTAFKEALELVYTEVLAHFEEVLTLVSQEKGVKKFDVPTRANSLLVTLVGAISLKNTMAIQTLIKELELLKTAKKVEKPARQQTLF